MKNTDPKVISKLVGMVLGDGHIQHTYAPGNARIMLSHSIKQKEYMEHKVELLSSIFGGPGNIRSYEWHGYTTLSYSTPVTSLLTELHKLFYVDKKKHVTQDLLDLLDDEGAALWFMDDGSMSAQKDKTGKVIGYSIRLCSDCFTDQEVMMIRDWFIEKYNSNFTIQRTENGCPRLVAGLGRVLPFLNRIKPYIIPSMLYKFDYIEPTLNMPLYTKKPFVPREPFISKEIH